MTDALLQVQDLSKRFRSDYGDLWAVRDVSFDLMPGQRLVITGPSGCGKTTLLNLIGLIMEASSGDVRYQETSLFDMKDHAQARMRNELFGYVVQNFALLYGETVRSNIRVPLLYRKKRLSRKEEDARIRQVLADVGLEVKLNEKVEHLSRGQQQRVAIARALVNSPRVILADEPTGALDTSMSEDIMQLLLDHTQEDQAMILVTHNLELADHCDVHLEMLDGRIVKRSQNNRKGERNQRS